MDKLKPCPFCGDEAEWKFGNLYTSTIVLCRCKKCHVRTDFVFIDHPSIDAKTGKLDETTRYTKEEAVAKAAEVWNRRAKNEELEFTRKFIHDNGLEFALMTAWNRRRTMNDREKLIELLTGYSIDTPSDVEYVADHLIANGVTFATNNSKWIPASEPPKIRGAYLSYIKYEPDSPDVVVENYYFGGRRLMSDTDRVTHWMPLPEPPKGGDHNE